MSHFSDRQHYFDHKHRSAVFLVLWNENISLGDLCILEPDTVLTFVLKNLFNGSKLLL